MRREKERRGKTKRRNILEARNEAMWKEFSRKETMKKLNRTRG